ncbi:hypothetical protein ABIC28_000390 [Rhodococcus sp. PvR044]|uniref:hypothetical protein n=1 Tax=Rhodococcus TaxID=1827 RepID=UPI000BCA1B1E|nr:MULTISPECIES: hypothetical protein [Rhodococcus]MBP1162857.1 hypothetical protein [Rhodococcus sp. PvR099]MCZ4554797.1 hypothetical protein [Rhodococcus maanshanensis]PTR44224.1 hypothetical protein C8K38_10458 [Rhodococcus sp. OK611]SNX89665.1 hypothetical protein SAMN05447004_10357 [Rhodococcus sp. OK270]
MAENTETTDKAGRRPSALLLLSGLAALLVSVWALIGPFHFESLGDAQFRWIVVIAAVVAGLILVFAPGRRK